VAIGNGGLDWARYAECAKPENDHIKDNFFSGNAEKKYIAKNLCFTCDVREDCIRWALEKPEIWGIWGGRDEDEIRRNLSVDAEGKEIRRGRFPQCGKCSARTSMLRVVVEDLPDGGRWTTAKYVVCTNCDFRWRSRSSANAVEAYHAQVAEKRSRAERARIRKSNLKKTAKK
jgi:WhiB family redox-sensing transcriptional regulator